MNRLKYLISALLIAASVSFIPVSDPNPNLEPEQYTTCNEPTDKSNSNDVVDH